MTAVQFWDSTVAQLAALAPDAPVQGMGSAQDLISLGTEVEHG